MKKRNKNTKLARRPRRAPSPKLRANAGNCTWRVAEVLCREWDLLTPAQKDMAIILAKHWGEEMTRCKAKGKATYFDNVIRWCCEDAHALNDVELQLWEGSASLERDPRVITFNKALMQRRRRKKNS